MQNTRRSERKPLLVEVEYESAGVHLKAHINNIGTLGVFIGTDSPLPVGVHLRLRFSLPGGRVIETGGVVAHRRTGAGMGIAFVSVGAEEVEHIRRFIDSE
ncbi:MAG: PilZ domain-containing protein [Blastocatellia bacterium]